MIDGKEFYEISSADRGGGGKIESKASIVQVKGIPLQVVPDGEIPEVGKDDVLEKLNQLELPENIQGVSRFNGVSSTQKCTPPFESGIWGVPEETHYTEVIVPIARGVGIKVPAEPTYVYYKSTRTVVIGTEENGQGCAILSSAAARETSGSDYEVGEIFIRKLLENTAASPSLWPILAYGRVGNEDFSRRFIVEPAYSNDQNLSSGSRVPREQIENHLFNILSQFGRFMSILERPISLKPLGMKGSVYIIPRDVRGGNILYLDGRIYLRDFTQWQFYRTTDNPKAIPVEIVAAHWATFNEFMASLKEFSRRHNLNPGGPHRNHAKFGMAGLSPRMKKFARVWNSLLGTLLDQSSGYGNVAEERLPKIEVEGKQYFVCSPPASLLRQILPKEFQGREQLPVKGGVNIGQRAREEAGAGEETPEPVASVIAVLAPTTAAPAEVLSVESAAAEQLIVSEVLSLETRADMMMTAFFADPQKRGSDWGDIVDRSNKVDLKDFVNYRRNLAPENWRKAADQDRQQIIDGLIEEIDTLVGEESKARHIGHIQVFVGAYRDALHEIGKIDAERKLRLGRFLMVDSGGSTRGDKNCLLFACLASEYGNLALQETNSFKRGVFLKRARFFHQASLFEGKSAGDIIFKGDGRIVRPAAGVEENESAIAAEAEVEKKPRQEIGSAEKNLLDEKLRQIASKRVPGAWENEYRRIMASPQAKMVYEGSRSRIAALTVLRLQLEFQNRAIDKKELFQIIGFVQAIAGRYNLSLAGEEGLSTLAEEFVNLAVDAALKEREKHKA